MALPHDPQGPVSVIEIADSVRKGATSEEVQAARLAVHSRKWVASKLLPKRYGDKLETENRNIHEASDPLAALLERIATSGRKVHDPRPRVIRAGIRQMSAPIHPSSSTIVQESVEKC